MIFAKPISLGSISLCVDISSWLVDMNTKSPIHFLWPLQIIVYLWFFISGPRIPIRCFVHFELLSPFSAIFRGDFGHRKSCLILLDFANFATKRQPKLLSSTGAADKNGWDRDSLSFAADSPNLHSLSQCFCFRLRTHIGRLFVAFTAQLLLLSENSICGAVKIRYNLRRRTMFGLRMVGGEAKGYDTTNERQ